MQHLRCKQRQVDRRAGLPKCHNTRIYCHNCSKARQRHTMAPSHVRRLVFVLFEDCLLLDFAGPLQAFELACETSEAGRAPYVWQICSLNGGLVKTSSGLEVMTTSLSDCDRTGIDTLIVGGGPGVHR